MNTLDEVIIGIREQIGLGDPILIDSLHYLKEYQKVTDVLHKHGFGSVWGITLPNPEKVEGKPDIDGSMNQPLTWDELKEMKGKPVWLEDQFQNNIKTWCIVERIVKDEDCEYIILDGLYFPKDYLGEKIDGWQAYRKERK